MKKSFCAILIPMISICILTKNAASTLKETLESVQSFDEVVILDNGSTDHTIDLAKSFRNVKIFTSPFIGFGPLRNEAAKLASHNWILALDSDEVLSPALIKELHQLELKKKKAYFFPRHNYYNKKRIRGCGWDPETVARLYHRDFARFSSTQVHEKLEALAPISHTISREGVTDCTDSPRECEKWGLGLHRLKSPILHTPYRSTADFLAKMQHYSTLFAEQNRKVKRSSFATAIAHAFYAFLRSYILKRGLFCGKEGFLISLYNANTTLYKYLKLAELNNSRN